MQICFQYLIPNRWEDAKLQSKNLKNAFDQSSPQHQQKSIKQAAVRVWWRCGKEFTSFFIHTNFWQKITLISCKHKKITILNTKFPSMLFLVCFLRILSIYLNWNDTSDHNLDKVLRLAIKNIQVNAKINWQLQSLILRNEGKITIGVWNPNTVDD